MFSSAYPVSPAGSSPSSRSCVQAIHALALPHLQPHLSLLSAWHFTCQNTLLPQSLSMPACTHTHTCARTSTHSCYCSPLSILTPTMRFATSLCSQRSMGLPSCPQHHVAFTTLHYKCILVSLTIECKWLKRRTIVLFIFNSLHPT